MTQDIEFTEEQFLQIEKLSAMGWDLKKIAMYFGLSYRSLQMIYDNCKEVEPCTLRYHFERGLINIQAEADQKIVDAITKGNITAIQMYQKQVEKNRIRDLKNDILNGNV